MSLQTVSGTSIISHTKREIPQCNRYLAKTAIFQLPVLSGIGIPGGPITKAEICERARANIIDNQIGGSIAVHGEGLFEEGTYAVDGTTVTLDNFRAFISNVFVENFADDLVTWTDIDTSQDQFLFIGLVEEVDSGRDDYKSSSQFGEFVTRVSPVSTPGQREILVARRTSGIGTIITNVGSEKKEFKTVEEHVFDDNPHGSLWTQDSGVSEEVTIRQEFDIVIGGDVTLSGVFDRLSGSPGKVSFNNKVIVEEDLFIRDAFRTEAISIFEDLAEFRSDLDVQSIRVESGVDVHSITQVSDDWEFSNIKTEEGVSFRPIEGAFGNRTSDGTAYQLFDPSAHAAALNGHLSEENPHDLTASGVSEFAIGVLSTLGDTLHNNLAVESGVAIDGIDFSTLAPLIDGSNADAFHKHLLLQPFEYQFLSPEYPNVVTSGVQPGWLEATYDEDNNRTQYSWFALQDVASAKIFVREYVPTGYVGIEDVTVYSRVSSGVGAGNVNLKIFDTTNTKVGEAHHMRNNILRPVTVSGIGGTFTEDSPYRFEVDMLSELGRGVHVSDIIIRWKT